MKSLEPGTGSIPRSSLIRQHTSVRTGDSLAFHVSTNPASSFTIEVYRLGYYQGHGARHMHSPGAFPGKIQADLPVETKRLRECQWEPWVKHMIPDDWQSGVYLGQLTTERVLKGMSSLSSRRTEKPICCFNTRTTPGMPTTAGLSILPSTTMVKGSSTGDPRYR